MTFDRIKDFSAGALGRVKALSPVWWSTVAGALVAGATVVPSHRVVAALSFGSVMFGVALAVTEASSSCECGPGKVVPAPPAPPTSAPPGSGQDTLAAELALLHDDALLHEGRC